MWFNRRYGSVGFVGTPFYLLTEVVSPAIELLALVTLGVAVAAGLFDPATFVVVLAAVAFVNAALAAGAILLDDLQSRLYRKRDLARILAFAPFELVLYRPIIFWARVKGSWRFLRGDKSWDRFQRNVRAPA
jgi:poly-beta-1,6-N-acetyl-D-glucosamine synthase